MFSVKKVQWAYCLSIIELICVFIVYLNSVTLTRVLIKPERESLFVLPNHQIIGHRIHLLGGNVCFRKIKLCADFLQTCQKQFPSSILQRLCTGQPHLHFNSTPHVKNKGIEERKRYKWNRISRGNLGIVSHVWQLLSCTAVLSRLA